jgi:hypothetical protein
LCDRNASPSLFKIPACVFLQARLGLPTRELPTALLVAPLGLDTVELVRKAYADSPALSGASDGSASILPRRQRSQDGSSTGSGGDSDDGQSGTRRSELRRGASAPAPEAAVSAVASGSSAVTASAATSYQEWPVIKTNQRGRRQERILGIDLTRITNKKVEKPRFLSSDKTSSAERLVADIWLIEVVDSDPKAFAITFKVGGADGSSELARVAYEAYSPSDRDSIIAKLAYILGMNGDRHKLRRAA